jgi:hypothetical protein
VARRPAFVDFAGKGTVMTRILGVLVLLVAMVAGVGYYLGWFRVSSDRAGPKPNVTITVDEDKIQADKEKAREKVHGLEEKAKEKLRPHQP